MNNNNNNNNNIDDDDVVDVDDDDNDTGVAGGSMIAASVHLQRDATEPSPLLMGGVSPAELTEEQKKKRDKAIADLGSNLTKEKGNVNHICNWLYYISGYQTKSNNNNGKNN